jgi:hypothetical protein
MSSNKYTVEEIPVHDLIVDRRVQRTGYEMHKVEKMTREWNPDAVGVAHVSRRDNGEQVILDGAHRHLVIKERTDNQGIMVCHVFTGLTLAEEAEIFLALNNTTQPMLIDKFRVRVVQGDPVATEIDQMVHDYGWVIARTPGNHHINAVGVLEKVYRMSQKAERDPNSLSLTMLVITRAWGNERAAGGAAIVEGIGRVFTEYGDAVDVENLINKLKDLRGGPSTLHAEATQLAKLRNGRVAMAVAELVVEQYNKNKRPGSGRNLPRWSKRS